MINSIKEWGFCWPRISFNLDNFIFVFQLKIRNATISVTMILSLNPPSLFRLQASRVAMGRRPPGRRYFFRLDCVASPLRLGRYSRLAVRRLGLVRRLVLLRCLGVVRRLLPYSGWGLVWRLLLFGCLGVVWWFVAFGSLGLCCRNVGEGSGISGLSRRRDDRRRSFGATVRSWFEWRFVLGDMAILQVSYLFLY